MSGHSKWATTKHKKAVIDARRGKNFAKLIKNVEVAARVGGGDPAGNPTLYDAIQKAKKSSVPNDNIERARKRGAGLEAGAEEINDLDDTFEIICEPTDLVAVRTALQDAGIDYESAEASFQPSVSVPVDLDGARKVLKLVDALEDSDDVQDVFTNMDIPDDVAAQLDED